MPTSGQIALLLLSIVLFAVGGGISIARLWGDQPALRIAAKACMWSGVLTGLVAAVWHVVAQHYGAGTWMPLEDNFDALLWLALLLAFFVMYVQRTRRLMGLDWFIMPVVILLLVSAVILGQQQSLHAYVPRAYSVVHVVTTFGGVVAFAIAGAAGTIYLLASRRLRDKSLMVASGPNFGSLERLEHVTFTAVTLGFALLTIGMITGVVWIHRAGGPTRLGAQWFSSPKVVLTLAVWVVYALVLHSPINPSFRGRKTALLSILGFVLMVGAVVAVLLMPGGAAGEVR